MRNETALPAKKSGALKKSGRRLLWFLVPSAVYVVVFHYLPIGGLVIAFLDYNSYQGILSSPWAGFKHFAAFALMPNFFTILKNTLLISVYSIAVNTVLPIILALLINEIRVKWFKKSVQTISYAPYFISTVVVVGMLFSFADYDRGVFNAAGRLVGIPAGNILESAKWFSTVYVVSGVWQGLGWWAIIYVGALAGVDQSLHEAAVLDGAGRLSRIRHVNLPQIVPMAVIMFILSVGNALNVGFEKVFLMQTGGNLPASEILSTYIYRVSLMSKLPQYSYAAAIGLFNSAVSLLLLWIANFVARKLGETSLW
ncbi:MAG: ABC transporter permease subunit [Clostridiales bacterium]|jgi:ABC-type polysaccharide transport system permease subunit|nr:ABC transporter permease subunit [Clostridiales bacterium]